VGATRKGNRAAARLRAVVAIDAVLDLAVAAACSAGQNGDPARVTGRTPAAAWGSPNAHLRPPAIGCKRTLLRIGLVGTGGRRLGGAALLDPVRATRDGDRATARLRAAVRLDAILNVSVPTASTARHNSNPARVARRSPAAGCVSPNPDLRRAPTRPERTLLRVNLVGTGRRWPRTTALLDHVRTARDCDDAATRLRAAVTLDLVVDLSVSTARCRRHNRDPARVARPTPAAARLALHAHAPGPAPFVEALSLRVDLGSTPGERRCRWRCRPWRCRRRIGWRRRRRRRCRGLDQVEAGVIYHDPRGPCRELRVGGDVDLNRRVAPTAGRIQRHPCGIRQGAPFAIARGHDGEGCGATTGWNASGGEGRGHRAAPRGGANHSRVAGGASTSGGNQQQPQCQRSSRERPRGT
jgi:hypothetical protein